MSKLDYIKSILKTLDKELLESTFITPEGNEVMFIEYCVKYVPKIMSDDFKLTGNEFIETMEDLVNYQKYKFEKTKKSVEVVEEIKIEVEEEKKEEITESHVELEDVSLSVDTPIVIEDTSISIEPAKEEVQTIQPKELSEEVKKAHYERTLRIKTYYKNALNLIPFFLKTSETLDEYIDMIYPYVDEDFNITENGFKVPFEEEIREKASLATNSFNYASNLLKAIKEKGINHVDITYIQGYIKSVNESFKPGNVYYDLAFETAKRSFDKLTTTEEKDKLFAEILSTPDIMNIELFESIKEYYNYSKREEMSELMEELTTEIPVSEIKKSLKEDELPRYILNALDQIKFASKQYEKLEIKDTNTLSDILNKLTVSMLDIENRIKDTNDEDLLAEYKKAKKLRDLVKLDKDFHDSIANIRAKYKSYKEQFEKEDGVANQYFVENFRSLEKEINRLFDMIESHRTVILMSEDMLLYEQISGTVAYLMNDLLEQKKQR